MSEFRILILLLVTAGAAGAIWYFWDDLRPSTEEIAIAPAEPDEIAAEPREPIHPIAPPVRSGSGQLVPLPPLDDSDAYFLLELTGILGAEIGPLLVNDALVDKFVATIDNLPRNHVAEAVRPVGRLANTIVVDSSSETGPYYLSPENYARYDMFVRVLGNADLDLVYDVYRRFYPLFQESYTRLGYPNGYFNDRVVEVIDHLLETPEPADQLQLLRPNVLYEFADPGLEALSSGQKLLLRIGPGNAARVKQVLRDFRALVAKTTQDPAAP